MVVTNDGGGDEVVQARRKRQEVQLTVPTRAGVNSAPELELIANSNSNSGIGIELELSSLELELNWNCHHWNRN